MAIYTNPFIVDLSSCFNISFRQRNQIFSIFRISSFKNLFIFFSRLLNRIGVGSASAHISNFACFSICQVTTIINNSKYLARPSSFSNTSDIVHLSFSLSSSYLLYMTYLFWEPMFCILVYTRFSACLSPCQDKYSHFN